jgi:hypothetical protein
MITVEQLTVALEAIDFQGDGLFQKLVKILGTLPRADRSTAKRDKWEKLEKAIEKAMKASTNLWLDVSIGDFDTFVVANPVFDLTSITFAMKGEEEKNPEAYIKILNKTKQQIRLGIDLKKSKFSGIMTEIQIPVMLEKKYFYAEIEGVAMSDEELVAIILHEIGHLATMVEMLDRVVTTNQILAETQRDLLGGDASKRETILKVAISDLSIDRNILTQLKSANDEVTTTVLLSNAVKTWRTQSGHSFYDKNTWEMMADQFAVRHGANSYLASGIRKYNIAMQDHTEITPDEFFTRQVLAYGGSLTLFTLAVFGFATGAGILGTVGLLFGLLMARADHIPGNEPTYDNAFNRLRRIREQILHQIKLVATGEQNNFSKKYKDQLLDQLEQMDKLMEGMSDRKSLIQRLQIFFYSSEANRHANVQLQKELEGLANNILYAKALAMKTI